MFDNIHYLKPVLVKKIRLLRFTHVTVADLNFGSQVLMQYIAPNVKQRENLIEIETIKQNKDQC